MDDVQVYWSPTDARWFLGENHRDGYAHRRIPWTLWEDYMEGFHRIGAASGKIWESGFTDKNESVTLPEYDTEREV